MLPADVCPAWNEKFCAKPWNAQKAQTTFAAISRGRNVHELPHPTGRIGKSPLAINPQTRKAWKMSATPRLCFLSLLAFLFLASAPLYAAQQAIPNFWDTTERLAKPDFTSVRHIRFLTTTDFPPLNFLDDSGRLSGFNVDMARAICRELGILDKCQIQALPWNELQDALSKHEGDAIIAGMGITPKSRETYAFSRSYLPFPARFVVEKGSALEEPIYRSIAGIRVGVLRGTAHERMLSSYFPAAVAVPYDNENALHADLKAGKVEAIFGDGMQLAFWLSGTDSSDCCRFAGGPYLSDSFLGEGLAIATRPDDIALVNALNYALHQIGVTGVFSELYLRYFPVNFF
jgi:polar amino acid transport system substrate-binding protein